MKTAIWMLCLIGLALAVQPETDHERETRSLFSNSDEGWPIVPLLNQLTQDQIRQLLQALLTALGPTVAPAPVSPGPLPGGR